MDPELAFGQEIDLNMVFPDVFREIKRPGCQQVLKRIEKGDTCGAVKDKTVGIATINYSGSQKTTIDGTACAVKTKQCTKGWLPSCDANCAKELCEKYTKDWVSQQDCEDFTIDIGGDSYYPSETYGQCLTTKDHPLKKWLDVDTSKQPYTCEVSGTIACPHGFTEWKVDQPPCRATTRIPYAHNSTGECKTGALIAHKTWVDEDDCEAFARKNYGVVFEKAAAAENTGGLGLDTCNVYSDNINNTSTSTSCFRVLPETEEDYVQVKGNRSCETEYSLEECLALGNHRYMKLDNASIALDDGHEACNNFRKLMQATSYKIENNICYVTKHNDYKENLNDKDDERVINDSSLPHGCLKMRMDNNRVVYNVYNPNNSNNVVSNNAQCGTQDADCLCKKAPSVIGCTNRTNSWNFCQPKLGEYTDKGVSIENLDAIYWCDYTKDTHHIDYIQKDKPKKDRICPSSHPWLKQWGDKNKCYKEPYCAVSYACAMGSGGETSAFCDAIDVEIDCTCSNIGDYGTCAPNGQDFYWCETNDKTNACSPNGNLLNGNKNWNYCYVRDACPQDHPYRTQLDDDNNYNKCYSEKKCTSIDPKNPSLPLCKYDNYERVPTGVCAATAYSIGNDGKPISVIESPLNGDGTDYTGVQAMTETGKTCENWSKPKLLYFYGNRVSHCSEEYTKQECIDKFDAAEVHYPNSPTGCSYNEDTDMYYYNTSNTTLDCGTYDTNQSKKLGCVCKKKHEYTSVGDHNYCRNVGGATTIWCYTTDPDTRWEYCDPLTDPNTRMDEGEDFVSHGALTELECKEKCDSDENCALFASAPGKYCTTYKNCDKIMEGDQGEAHMFMRNESISSVASNKPSPTWVPVEKDDEIVLTYGRSCDDIESYAKYKPISDVNLCKKAKNDFLGSVSNGVAYEDIKDKIIKDGLLTIDDGPVDINSLKAVKPYTLMTINTDTLPHGCLHISQPDDSPWNGWLHNASTKNVTNPVSFTSSRINPQSLETIPPYCSPNKDCAIGMLCERI